MGPRMFVAVWVTLAVSACGPPASDLGRVRIDEPEPDDDEPFVRDCFLVGGTFLEAVAGAPRSWELQLGLRFDSGPCPIDDVTLRPEDAALGIEAQVVSPELPTRLFRDDELWIAVQLDAPQALEWREVPLQVELSDRPAIDVLLALDVYPPLPPVPAVGHADPLYDVDGPRDDVIHVMGYRVGSAGVVDLSFAGPPLGDTEVYLELTAEDATGAAMPPASIFVVDGTLFHANVDPCAVRVDTAGRKVRFPRDDAGDRWRVSSGIQASLQDGTPLPTVDLVPDGDGATLPWLDEAPPAFTGTPLCAMVDEVLEQ